IGPYSVNYVGYWDGSEWNDMGGTDAKVEALAYDGNFLWIGGIFTNVDVAGGGAYSPGLALFQDGSWYAGYYWVTGGGQSVSALGWDSINNNLYAGGNFTSADSYNATVPANNIAVFNEDTGNWSALGSGLNGTVNAILATNDVVYVGGSFTTAGGVTVNGIAKWDATAGAWSALGSGVSGTGASPEGSPSVNSLVMIGTNLYVGGSFTNAGGVFAQGLAVWNGSTWSGLGSGVYDASGFSQAGFVDALAAIGNNLYAGGVFTTAGSKPSSFIAHWNDQLDYYPTPHPFLSRGTWLPGDGFQFRLGGTSGESYILEGSTNFVHWTPLFTNSATLYDFTDPNALIYPHRFYRSVLGP
ncbi:MAG: hypothetical protein ACREFR_13890, partial [Limisphaerales bacterium]